MALHSVRVQDPFQIFSGFFKKQISPQIVSESMFVGEQKVQGFLLSHLVYITLFSILKSFS